jgi:exonuclease VII large subunit
MKTIKQIADELGVSKQAINRYLCQLPPTTVTTNEKGIKQINASGEAILRSLVKPKSTTNQTIEPPTKDSVTDKVIKLLEKELTAKNKQIDDLNSRLAETSSAMIVAQQLHAGTIQKQLTTVVADERDDEGHNIAWYRKNNEEICGFLDNKDKTISELQKELEQANENTKKLEDGKNSEIKEYKSELERVKTELELLKTQKPTKKSGILGFFKKKE